jgi:hypothetical membrane protein
MDKLLIFGIVAPLWMLLGVVWVAPKYPGYSHKAQVMSELGARSRPAQQLQPFVNNYPIGVLFSTFGIGLLLSFPDQLHVTVSGILILLHGASHIVAGLYPCDADLGLENPSTAQKLHNTAGFVMYLTLLVACLFWVQPSSVAPDWFRLYSLASAVASVIFTFYMVRAMKGSGSKLGLYQRLSYGILAAWSATLAVVLLVSA